MTSGLNIRVDKFLEGEEIVAGVPVTIRKARDGVGTGKFVAIVAAPVSARRGGAFVELAPGSYELEAPLPSGEVLFDQAIVRDANDNTMVVLRGEASPNEWRSWTHFGGSRAVSKRERGSPYYRAFGPTTGTSGKFQVCCGYLAATPGTGDHFDPSRWQSWYDYLEERARRAEEELGASEDLQFEKSDGTFDVDVLSDGSDAPTIIRVTPRRGRSSEPLRFGGDRPFISISSAAGQRVYSLPWPWPEDTASSSGAFLDILAAERDGVLMCDPVIRDSKLGGLVAYLNAGRVGLAGELLQAAHQALFDKYDNPLGAAAGGYVLLSTAGSESLGKWPIWLENLAVNFPELPDGAILRARWLLGHDKGEYNHKDTHDLLFSAFERGLPYFSAGVAWLIEGMRRTSTSCATCQAALRTIRGVARFMDLSQSVVSFDLSRPASKASSLSPPLKNRNFSDGVVAEHEEDREVERYAMQEQKALQTVSVGG